MNSNALGMDTRPSNAGEIPCEWCGIPSIRAVQNPKRKGLYTYACRTHLHLAEKANSRVKAERGIP